MKFTLVLFDLDIADNNSSITQRSHQNFLLLSPVFYLMVSTPKMDFKVIHYVKKKWSINTISFFFVLIFFSLKKNIRRYQADFISAGIN